MTVFELIYQRSFFSLILVSSILYLTKKSMFAIEKDLFLYILVRVLGSAFAFFLEVVALQFIPISKVIIVMYNPFITSIISFVLIKEKITKYDMLSFFFCTLGVIFITNPFRDLHFEHHKQ
jgi:drug/metabolite transporter (DMT)-like permease